MIQLNSNERKLRDAICQDCEDLLWCYVAQWYNLELTCVVHSTQEQYTAQEDDIDPGESLPPTLEFQTLIGNRMYFTRMF